MTARELALLFLRRFAAGDVEGLAPLLADDLRVTGPHVDAASRADYLAALRGSPPEPATVRIVSLTDSAERVAVFYEYGKRDSTRIIAQLFRCRDQRIREMILVFDARD